MSIQHNMYLILRYRDLNTPKKKMHVSVSINISHIHAEKVTTDKYIRGSVNNILFKHTDTYRIYMNNLHTQMYIKQLFEWDTEVSL